MTRSLPYAFVALLTAGCGEARDVLPRKLEPPPVQEPTLIERLPLDGSLQRDAASLLEVTLIEIPKDETDTEAKQLLGDGTLYHLQLDTLGKTGAALVRFDDVAGGAPTQTRIPLVAPPGQKIRSEERFTLGLRVATSSGGVLMDRNRQGSVWWEEDGPKGRLIEFRIDGDRATMVPPGAPLDDSDAPVAHRFNRTPAREVSFRFTTGAVDVGADVPAAFLGGRGFSLALARIGHERTEAFLESPASDLPHVDVAEPAPGLLTVTIGYIRGSGHATQVTYDSKARRWQDHRPLVVFPEAQGVEVADVGPAGVLVVLGLAWNGARHDPETGLYWVRRDRPVRHLLQRVRELQTATLPDGFVALFEDETRRDRSRDEPRDMLVLRAQGERLSLYTFKNPGPCFSEQFAWLGGNRFAATFCGHQLVVFEVPDFER